MAIGKFGGRNAGPVSRRTLLRAGAGLAGGALLPSGLILPAFAEDQPPLGTWPDGSKGSSVFVGISVPRTGTYAAAGEDLIKGYELAIEHLNTGSEDHDQDLAQHQEGRARQGGEVWHRRQRGQAQHRGSEPLPSSSATTRRSW